MTAVNVTSTTKPRVVSSSDDISRKQSVSRAAYEAARAAEDAEAERILKRNVCLTMLYQQGEMLSSIGVSIVEEAFRGSSDTAMIDHIYEARRIVMMTLEGARELKQLGPCTPRPWRQGVRRTSDILG